MSSKYSLSDVFRILDADDGTKVKIYKSRALDKVVEFHQNHKNQTINALEAHAFIVKYLKTLTANDFSKRTLWKNDSRLVMDEYGKEFENELWYIKFWIADDCLEQISFHPAERDIKLANGKTLKARKRKEGTS